MEKFMKRYCYTALIAFVLTIGWVITAHAQNLGKTILPSAARTIYPAVSADQVNNAGNAIHCIFDTTVFTSGTVTLTIQGKDPASGKYYTLLTGTAVGSVVTQVYKVFPGAPVTANVSANDSLPTIWRISLAGASTPVSTNSVGCLVME